MTEVGLQKTRFQNSIKKGILVCHYKGCFAFRLYILVKIASAFNYIIRLVLGLICLAIEQPLKPMLSGCRVYGQ